MSAPFKCGKGVNKDLLPSELEPGYWSDMLNFRSRNGFDEKFEGSSAIVLAEGPNGFYDEGLGYMFPYASGTNYYAVYGNNRDVYAILNGTNTKISRYSTDELVISSITRIGANTAELTTSTAHALSTGDKVSVFEAVEDGYNETAVTITVTAATVFRYTTTNTIAGNATTVGKMVVHTKTSAGVAFSTIETYPSLVALNGIFFLYAPAPTVGGTPEGLYYWNGDTTTLLRRVPFTVPSAATKVSGFKNYLIACAGDNVYWTDAAEPGAIPTTMVASATNDAGENPLAETPGDTVDSMPLGDINIVYKKDSIWAMQYIGGNDVFAFTRLPGNDGLYRPWCVVNTPAGHVFVTQNLDIRIHSGGASKSIAEGRVRKFFTSDFDYADTTIGRRIFLCVNPEKSEVWICYPTTNSSRGCDKALVWNWESDAWGIFSLSNPAGGSTTDGLSFAQDGSWHTGWTSRTALVLMFNGGLNQFKFRVVSSSATQGLTGTLERTGIDFGDRDTFKSIQQSRWNFDGTAGNTATIYHGSSKTADGSTTWATGATYTIGTTDKADGRATQGRFGAVKLSTTANLSVRSVDLEVTGGAKR